MHLLSPVNDGNNGTAYKTYLKLSIEAHKKHKLAKKIAVANITERQ